MIPTLAWKEVREHSSIWVAMVFMTFLMGWGMAKILPSTHPMSIGVPDLIILGLAVTYGVVCGGMMFAGEHENGTLAFLDIFHGRRGSLWGNKMAIGVVLVVTQALAVAATFYFANQGAPAWLRAMLGGLVRQQDLFRRSDASIWFFALPLVTLEAYAWGLLGSAFTRRVLTGAGIALMGLVPAWMLSLCSPAEAGLVLRLIAIMIVLSISATAFVQQPRDMVLAPSTESLLDPLPPPRPREHYLDRWDRADEHDEFLQHRRRIEQETAREEAARASSLPMAEIVEDSDPAAAEVAAPAAPSFRKASRDARSPSEVINWLTWKQAAPIVLALSLLSLAIGALLPAAAPVVWPMATLLVGATCGCMAFAQEQRDLSYQFLASQHFPLRMIWRTKLLLWAGIALGSTIVMLLMCGLVFGIMAAPRLAPRVDLPRGFLAPFPEQMGLATFLGIWLVYGFCLGQAFVWFFRKTILAILLTFLTAGAAVLLWVPSLMCGGMAGWQVWLPPVLLLVAGWRLVRFWAGGCLSERKHVWEFVGFCAATLAWAGLYFGYRAWEIPNVGPQIDVLAFKAELQADPNRAGKVYQRAMGEFVAPEVWPLPNQPKWITLMTEAAQFPPGMIELPRGDGQRPQTGYLEKCEKMVRALRHTATRSPPDQAVERLAELLAFSRTLRNKAGVQSYVLGVEAESQALDGLHELVSKRKPSVKLMQRVRDELTRHAAETPPALDCLRTECYISSGVVNNPNVWGFVRPDDAVQGDRSLAGTISLSMEMPWEAERKARLWQVVWSGMFRTIETPFWQRPDRPAEPAFDKTATRIILQGWTPPSEGGPTYPRVARWLDDSWLADERLFFLATNLQKVGTRSQCRVDAMRLAMAVSLYQLENGPLARLNDLVPNYLAELPKDPYSGEGFRFAAADPAREQPAKIWSTGPDRVDDGGRTDGHVISDESPRWLRGGLDLITSVP